MNNFAFMHADTSRVSFEAADRPNFFLYASPSGQVKLAKWEESEAFWDGATFVLRRNTWIPGYDSLESHAKPGFFLHATLSRLHLLKYRHTDSFRKATLFRLTGQQHWNDRHAANTSHTDHSSNVGGVSVVMFKVSDFSNSESHKKIVLP